MRSAGGITGGATRRLVLAALFAGLGVMLSSFAIPVGASRVFPFQHAINVVAGVLLGPWWAAGSALVTATLRFSLGTGSLFAFPGSPFGALAVGLAYRYLRRDEAAQMLTCPVSTLRLSSSNPLGSSWWLATTVLMRRFSLPDSTEPHGKAFSSRTRQNPDSVARFATDEGALQN